MHVIRTVLWRCGTCHNALWHDLRMHAHALRGAKGRSNATRECRDELTRVQAQAFAFPQGAAGLRIRPHGAVPVLRALATAWASLLGLAVGS